MKRLFAYIFLPCLVLAALFVPSAQWHPWLDAGRQWVASRLAVDEKGYTIGQCEQDVLATIRAARAKARAPEAPGDPSLCAWLRANSDKISATDMAAFARQVQAGQVRYPGFNVCAARANRMKDLVPQMAKASFCNDAKYNATGVIVRKSESGYEALMVMGMRVEDFTPEAISEHLTDTFVFTCPHCKTPQTFRAKPRDGGFDLRCPKCGLSGGILATDALGTYRYANEFLLGYQPPAVYPADMTREHEMYVIWNAVSADCCYRKDTMSAEPDRDVWQLPLETMVRGQGDCEDTSLLLADWLITRGFNARVVLGRVRGGGHAWCVVKLDGKEFLLESTNASPNRNVLPYVSSIGAEYEPVTQFDRDYIYVRSRPSDRFGGSYWAAGDWIRLQPRPPKPSPALAKLQATPPAEGRPVLAVRTAKNTATGTEVACPELERLRELMPGADAWQIVTPFSASRR